MIDIRRERIKEILQGLMTEVEVHTDLQVAQDRQEVVRVGVQLLSQAEVQEAVIRLVKVGVVPVQEVVISQVEVREALQAISQVGLATVVRVQECQGQAQVALLPVQEVRVLLQESLI